MGNKRNSRYSADEEVFDRPLTPATAWALGIIVGDGCIIRRQSALKGLDVCGDQDVCEKVAAVLGSDAPVYYLRGNCWDVRIFSRKLAASLGRLGIQPAKTYTVPFPDLPEELFSHFVRGFWDADGCVQTKQSGKNKILCLSAVSCSRLLMKRLHAVLEGVVEGHVSLHTRMSHPPRAEKYIISLGEAASRCLGAWLWGSSEPAIRGDRKFDHFHDLASRAAERVAQEERRLAEVKSEAARLYAAGWSQPRIGSALGVHRLTIGFWVRAAGVGKGSSLHSALSECALGESR